jgi:hypothetical protein
MSNICKCGLRVLLNVCVSAQDNSDCLSHDSDGTNMYL